MRLPVRFAVAQLRQAAVQGTYDGGSQGHSTGMVEKLPWTALRSLASDVVSCRLLSYSASMSAGRPGEAEGDGGANGAGPTLVEENGESHSLPLAQRCKNVLASNWRGQLSTIKAGSDKKDARSVHGSTVQYALLEGKPVVWLPVSDAHQVNLLMDDRGSVLVGHTDPPPLIAAFRAVKKVPPRVILLGDFVHIEQSEIDYLRRRIEKQASAARALVDKAGPNLQEILETSGSFTEERAGILADLGSSASGMSAYRLYARSCHYVDVLEGRHSVAVADVVGAATDPLAGVHAAIVEGVNHSHSKRRALVLFCAAYLQIQVRDAYLFSADRWGFNVLAQPTGSTSSQSPPEEEAKQGPWREFRFAFSREIRDAEGFSIVLKEMEKEVMAAASESSQSSDAAVR